MSTLTWSCSFSSMVFHNINLHLFFKETSDLNFLTPQKLLSDINVTQSYKFFCAIFIRHSYYQEHFSLINKMIQQEYKKKLAFTRQNCYFRETTEARHSTKLLIKIKVITLSLSISFFSCSIRFRSSFPIKVSSYTKM